MDRPEISNDRFQASLIYARSYGCSRHLRVVVLDLDPIDDAKTYVNPEITWASPEMIMHQEGSVSMPGVNDDVQRHARVRISYQDIDGNLQTEESHGLRAVCHQHEIDQLNGMFW